MAEKYDFLGSSDPQKFFDEIHKKLFSQIKNGKRKLSSANELEKIDSLVGKMKTTYKSLEQYLELARHLSILVSTFQRSLEAMEVLATALDNRRTAIVAIDSSPAQFLINFYKNPNRTLMTDTGEMKLAPRIYGEKAWTEKVVEEWRRLKLIEKEDSLEIKRLRDRLNVIYNSTLQNVSKEKIKKPRKKKY